jgi:ABC-type branched-subunit amino acid transport system substrate-binding protein
MSGPRAIFGSDAQDGVTIAFEHLRRAGETPLFTLKFEDSQGDPQKGVSAYRKLLQDDLRLVITQNSNISMAIAPLTINSDLIQLAVTTTADAYSTPRDNTFRLNGPLKPEAELLAATIQRSFGAASNVALLTLEDQYPVSLRQHLLEALSSYGIKPALNESFGPDEVDFRAFFTRAKKAKCTHYVFLAYATQGGFLVKQLKDLVPDAQYRFGNASMRGKDFFEAAGSAAEGVVVTYIAVDSSHPAATEFQKRFSKEANIASANAYDAVFIVQRAFRECGRDTTAACLRSALFKIKNYNGMSGIKSFDDVYGDMADSYSLKVARGNTFVDQR